MISTQISNQKMKSNTIYNTELSPPKSYNQQILKLKFIRYLLDNGRGNLPAMDASEAINDRFPQRSRSRQLLAHPLHQRFLVGGEVGHVGQQKFRKSDLLRTAHHYCRLQIFQFRPLQLRCHALGCIYLNLKNVETYEVNACFVLTSKKRSEFMFL